MQAISTLAVCLSLLGAPQDSTVYFVTSSHCHYCDVMKPIVARLAQEGYRIETVSADERPDLVRQLRVSGFPTFVLMQNGQELERVVGAQSFERMAEFAQPAAAPRAVSPSQFADNGAPREIPGMRYPQEGPGAPNSLPPSDAQPLQPPRQGPVQQGISDLAERRALGATVRIKIDEADGVSYGTGVIVDVHRTASGDEALIGTCGHLFRDSQGKAELTVDFPTRQDNRPVPGTLLDYTADDADIAVIYISLPFAVEPVPVADRLYQPQVGEPVFSIGCDQGGPARVMRSAVSAVNRYVGPPNVEVKGAPSLGRSGGGLFDAEGQLIGICNAMDPQDDEGIYAGLALVHWQLAKIGQQHVFDNVAQAEPLGAEVQGVGHNGELPEFNDAVDRGQRDEIRRLDFQQEAVPPAAGAAPLPSLEAVLTLRDRNRPDAPIRTIIIDGPSDRFMNSLNQERIRLGDSGERSVPQR